MARSVIAGKPASGCLAWKLRAIGRISATARQPDQSCVLHSHQNRWHRPLHRPDRLRLERIAVLREGRRGGDRATASASSKTLTGIELAAASATRWGGTVGVGWEYGFAPNWSAGIEYDHLFMGHANNSFSVDQSDLVGFAQQPDQPGRGHGHLAHQLPLRRLRQPGRREILTSSCYDISSKLGRQKCRPFCWRLSCSKPSEYCARLSPCSAARRYHIAASART